MKDFVFHASYLEAINELSAKDRLKAYEAICNFGVKGQEIEGLKGAAKIILNMAKPIIISEQNRRETLIRNGSKGGRPKKPKQNQMENQNKTNWFLNEKPKQNLNKDKDKDMDIDKDIDKDKDIIIETSNDVSSSELKKAPSRSKHSKEDIFIELPLNDGSMYQVTVENVNEWKNLYGNVDIEQQLKNMKGWLLSNPSRRKTSKGIMRFINSWLTSEQDKGSKAAKPGYSANSSTRGVYGMPRDQASADAAANAIWQNCEEILNDGKR